MIPGISRAVWHSGASGGGTGRTADWSTYDGTNDTAWQQWMDQTSTALDSNYQVIKSFKNLANPTIDTVYMAIDNNGTQTVGKWQLDAFDATSAQIELGAFHNLGTNKVVMQTIGKNHILTSAVDDGSIVVFNNSLTDSGKVSGFFYSALDDFATTDQWDFVAFETLVGSGSPYGPPYDYTTDYYGVKGDFLLWIWPYGQQLGASHAVFQKGNYVDNNNVGVSSGRDGVNELISTPSQSPAYSSTGRELNQYGDIYWNDGNNQWENIVPQVYHMRGHYLNDRGSGVDVGFRETDRIFLSAKMYEDTGTETENVFKMVLANHYMYDGQGGFGGSGVNYTLHSESSYRSDSDVRYYKATGRSINNVNNQNMASMLKSRSLIQLYNDESGTNGGNLYVAAITDTNETASSDLNPTSHDNGNVAEMFYFDEVTADDTHGTNAKIVSTTNSSDSTNTSFDPEAVCMGDLHGNYFGVAWRQATTAYISIFSITEPSADQPTITREVDTINLGTVPEGRMALTKMGPGVALITCGNYYRIIKTDTI